ncbi:PH domain-containing protein [Halobacterium zhouii]|uniref:PH domain-containing protein n=1 Tax=Halobacterium zhouii TaxID=2902624 RepID=UPI001E4DAC9E|nr:PH domain-containing protein [Halobacterium zhouii]
MKLHPLSVPYRLLTRGLNLAWAVLVGGIAFADGNPLAISGLVVLLVLAVAAGVAYEVAYYRRFDYELTDDSLDIHSGVFSRREREIPLRRVQNVDVTRTFVARLLGLAEVDVETAGGGETEASLQYVGREEATRLQDDIRKRRARVTAEQDETSEESPEAAAEGESAGETLFELSDRDLVLYGVLSFDPRLVSGVLAFAPFVWPFVSDVVPLEGLGVVVVAALAVVGTLVLWAVSAVARIVRFYGFRLRRVGDDLRYERGLLQRYDGTIPVSKLQTVSVEENVLMRRYGFASLAVETAGYAPGSSPSGGSEAAVPLAAREDVLGLARTLEDFHDFELSRPPERARKRYVRRYALAFGAVALLAFGVSQIVAFPWYVALVLLPLAFPAARLAHANRGYDAGPRHAVTQAGFWRRQTRIVPYDRVQTVIRRQTVFQRRWNLTTVVLDTAGSRSISGGDASAIDRDDADADHLAEETETQLLDAVYGRLGSTETDRRNGDGNPDAAAD